MKHTTTNMFPVTATLVRVNEALDWNSSTKHFKWSGMAKCFFRRKWKGSVA